MVMEVVHEEMGEGTMQCANHPYKNSSPGGICAFCLQEKLGKLVSSSFPLAVFPRNSSSSSPSFRSDGAVGIGGSVGDSYDAGRDCGTHRRRREARSRLPFRLMHKRKKEEGMVKGRNFSEPGPRTFVYMRSKSTAGTPGKGLHFIDENHKKGFWSFLYTPKDSGVKKIDKVKKGDTQVVLMDENVSPDDAPVERKVSRSRSIGCGSRSFSGDLFERISTGFSDCTLRRAESQREGKLKGAKNGSENEGNSGIKERVKCGRVFSGFMINSSSTTSEATMVPHGRNRVWGWTLASPMRAFKPRKQETNSNMNSKSPPNLDKIPSLLTDGSKVH